MQCRKVLVAVTVTAGIVVAAGLGTYTPAERRHWSFQPRTHPKIPSFADAAAKEWVHGPVDAFVLEKLRANQLEPAPAADRATLIRRVTFDLTGLPPDPAEVAAFVGDQSPKAYENLVDRLLASPRYGERWGQHWLDVVRFAESDGFEYDTHRHDAWRYRDYVIRAFNSDKPYNEFIREQLAGDEIAPLNEEMRIAAGFNRLGPLRKNAGNQEVASSRNEVLTDMTNSVGAAILGVTVGCARCHDHKFDPIRQTDYYRMEAFFAATHESDVALAGPDEQAEWKARQDVVQKRIAEIKKAMKDLTGEAHARMEKKLEEVEATLPDPLPSLYSVADDAAKATSIHVLARGDYQNKGEAVGMRPLGVLLPDNAPEVVSRTPRADLANWILAPDHPLTARVLVNRIWQFHFGQGIVATPNDFGRMGARPSHPELLDYLANRFVESGWHWKPIHREILLSSTYRQASVSPLAGKAEQIDAGNKLLWKFSRRRLEAEELRDSMLWVAGVLNEKRGGPSVIVPVDKDLVNDLYKPTQWSVTPDAAEHNRRTVYLLAKRNLRLPFMQVFDAPDLQISCARRESSTHAPQALELLNGDLTNRLADAFAARLAREGGASRVRQVDLAFRLTTGRAPTPKERQIALRFLASEPPREFALAMLNLNEFLYVN